LTFFWALPAQDTPPIPAKEPFDGETAVSELIFKKPETSLLLGTLFCCLCNVMLILASPSFAASIALSAR